MTWETVIGLEIHVQLATASKLFCSCRAAFGAHPNTQTCPVCVGLPGTLPVPNAKAVALAVRAATALNFTIHETSVFARKQYFYPDLPKGYQITQYDRPLATDGKLDVHGPDRDTVSIGLERLHLEEDAGKSLHDVVPGHSALDYNRSGTPLIEIVTKPDLRSPREARAFLVALKRVLEYIEVSDCSMEQGSLRVDANGSVRQPGEPLGVKQEIKNMNSFGAVERALEQLHTIQIEQRERGETLERTTFSAATGTLHAMRSKETTEDYRYLPDPDLPPIALSAYGIDTREVADALPELPAPKVARFVHTLGLSADAATVLAATPQLASYFEAVVAAGGDPTQAANWVRGPVLADANDHDGQYRLPPNRLAALIRLVETGEVSRQAGVRLFDALVSDPGDARTVATRLGLVQVSDEGQLASWIDEVMQEHRDEADRARQGESRLIDFLIGSVMRRSRGRADPQKVARLLRDRLC